MKSPQIGPRGPRDVQGGDNGPGGPQNVQRADLGVHPCGPDNRSDDEIAEGAHHYWIARGRPGDSQDPLSFERRDPTVSNQSAAIHTLAMSIFEDEQTAKDWLQEPNLATDSRPPKDLLGTPEGLDRVKTLLQRIEYGVLS